MNISFTPFNSWKFRKRLPNSRRGQSLVEFAVVSLVTYMLLAATLTFGYLIFVAQGMQQAADLGARELSQIPLDPELTFEDALQESTVQDRIYSEDYLVFDLATLGTQNFFTDVVPTWPLLNQQLATMMIVDRPDLDGDGNPDHELLRYPGTLLSNPATPTGFTVGIALVESRDGSGTETIRWVPVVEEIDTEQANDNAGTNPDPFQVGPNPINGVVALRINYPFQSASMSSFRSNPAGQFEPTLGNPNIANDGGVVETNASERPGGLVNQALAGGSTYGGTYGLGAQEALGQVIRPYRRVISTQAIYRREVFQ
ncbi:MAG: pilus assembly protein TadE [Blastopirellula sp.]|nr:pilus assembly protein TadE [Blastopirellula sp.]